MKNICCILLIFTKNFLYAKESSIDLFTLYKELHAEPAIKTGVKAMTSATLDLFNSGG
tara:strand:- start:14472 stop:14645 length:174 start_codon:yes stop_codon:yes gene_type:complete